MIRFALGKLKIGDGPATAPGDGLAVPSGTVAPEESSSPTPSQIDASVTVLRVTDILPYEKNPRQAANPLFDTIKASIRQRGMDAPLKVTRRPGATHYVVAAGGNTRLLAQLQLWQESGDSRFETIPVVIKAWRSESDVLAGHLIENEQRADMTFWDKARGVVALKSELEQEGGAALSLRQWESALADIGLPVGKDVLSTYLFAVQRLGPLGPVLTTLSRNDVRDHLHPCFRRLGRLAQKFGLGEAALYAHTLDPAMRSQAQMYQATQTFSAAELTLAADSESAQALQITVPKLKAMLALLDQSPELPLTELRTRTAGALVVTPVQTLPIAPASPHHGAGTRYAAGTVSPGDRDGTPARFDNSSAGVAAHGDFCGIADVGDVTTQTSARPLDALKQALLEFAQMMSCADCLHWYEGLPFDFYVEVPSTPLDLEPMSPRRHAGWWLLAFLSGQFDPELAALLPEDSAWRSALGAEGDWGDEHLSMLIQTQLGGSLAPDALVGWLTRAPDAAAENAWQCLQLARQVWSRRSSPGPSGSTSGEISS